MKWKLLKIGFVVVAVIAAFFAGRHYLKVLKVASAFHAKTLCSGIFVSGRPGEMVVGEDVLADMPFGLRRLGFAIDRNQGLVTSSLFGLAERRALYRPGLGCTLVNGTTLPGLRRQAEGFAPIRPAIVPAAPWPEGDAVDTASRPGGIDHERLTAALDAEFDEPHPRALRRTRAVVVVHKGRIIAERYAAGINPDTPLIGWSMGKSIASALVAILVRDGKIDMAKGALLPEWRQAGDPRAKITVDHLLRMTSGLDFDDPRERMLSDVRRMLFLTGDSFAYARSKEAAGAPGTLWRYGSGSTSLLAGLLRQAAGGNQLAYFNFPRRALLAPLGMASAVLEPDAAGTFLMPAFVYASPRDWARFGLFILNDGVWQERRILPEGWVEYAKSPTGRSGGLYGAHFWLKVPRFLRPDFAEALALPDDRFYMLGNDGQMVAIIPSLDLVVVRMGLSRRRNSWDPDAFLFNLVQAFAKAQSHRPSAMGRPNPPAAAQRGPGFNWGRADRPER
ncbi:MAG: beta-lactamase family protein [Hyphomicrobiales bacterium]|nr:beta-lactamase family protein [Hyphomicrobiales bacterium]